MLPECSWCCKSQQVFFLLCIELTVKAVRWVRLRLWYSATSRHDWQVTTTLFFVTWLSNPGCSAQARAQPSQPTPNPWCGDTPHIDLAFSSVEHIMRDVTNGWFLRYMHANGASVLFIAIYLHIFRGLYYGSYNSPREFLWCIGVVLRPTAQNSKWAKWSSCLSKTK